MVFPMDQCKSQIYGNAIIGGMRLIIARARLFKVNIPMPTA